MPDKSPTSKLMNSSWDSMIRYMFWTTREYETMPPVALVAKLAEETGEFAEAILKESGYLRHKDKEFEGPIGEAADCMNVLIGALAVQFPDKTPDELTEELLEAFKRKGQKYAGLIKPTRD